MVEVSKLSIDTCTIGTVPCKQLIHVWTDSCLQAFIDMSVSSFSGGLKYFLPFHIIPIVSNFFLLK